jgi:hypothetical protein
MRNLILYLLSAMILVQFPSASVALSSQEAGKKQDQGSTNFDPKTTLEDGISVKLRISQTVSSADSHVNDRVEFEVLEDIKVADTLIVPKGGIACG